MKESKIERTLAISLIIFLAIITLIILFTSCTPITYITECEGIKCHTYAVRADLMKPNDNDRVITGINPEGTHYTVVSGLGYDAMPVRAFNSDGEKSMADSSRIGQPMICRFW